MNRTLRTPPILRPRLTWKYVLSSAIVLYVTYCFLFASPLFASKLPRYTGPYSVGTIDVENPCDGRTISDFRFHETGEPAFKLETVLFTIYYPSKDGAVSSKQPHYWVPKPISLTAEGYARFGRINNFFTNGILTSILWTLIGGITIPARVDVPLSESFSSLQPVVEADMREKSSQFPVLVFSHGYASSRTDYTHYLGALASRGYVVAAIEHRDGSGPATVVMRDAAPGRTVFPLRLSQMTDSGKRENGDFKQAQLDFRQAEQRPFKGGIMLDPGKNSGQLNHNVDAPVIVIHSNSWSRKHSIFFGRPHFDVVEQLVQGVLKKGKGAWFMTSLGTSHPSVTDAPLIEPVLLSWTTGATIDVKEGVHQYVQASEEFLRYQRTGERTGLLALPVSHPEYGDPKHVKDDMPPEYQKYWEIHVAPK